MKRSLLDLDQAEWESLCDGCARCCLVKLQDEGTDELYYTNIACKFLDHDTCRCSVYSDRGERNPECVILSKDDMEIFQYMPTSCAYRRFERGLAPLPTEEVSVRDLIVSEEGLVVTDYEDHVIDWIEVDSS